MFYCDILCLIIILTLIGLILYQKYYNTNVNEPKSEIETETEPFLVLNDIPLYTRKNEMNTPISIKSQIPAPVNQLNGNELQNIDSSILRHSRVLKNFSIVDELDYYQMYNILKQLKNNQYKFTYNTSNTNDLNTTPLSSSPSIISSENLTNINSGAINNIDLNLFTRMKLEIISSFNNFVINAGDYVPYHPYQFFKIINSNLISFDKNYKKDSNNNSDNYCFTLTFAREYKYQQFVIYYDIDLIKIIDVNTSIISYSMILNKVDIIGMPVPNTIEFHKNNKIKTDDIDISNNSNNTNNSLNSIEGQLNKQSEISDYYNNDFYYKDQVSESSTNDVMPGEETSRLFQRKNMKYIDDNERSDMDLTLLDKDSMSVKIDEKIMNIAKDQQFNNHRCYGLVNGINQELPQYKNPIFCKSYHPEINQNGIWDAPCQVDNDCPFYKANKNYTNEFGKCDKESGSCEMPLGVIPIGFTKYGKIDPNCYNCNITSKDSKCCGTQMDAIKEGNVKYKSPDYIFNNDESFRKQFKDELELVGLKVNPSI